MICKRLFKVLATKERKFKFTEEEYDTELINLFLHQYTHSAFLSQTCK